MVKETQKPFWRVRADFFESGSSSELIKPTAQALSSLLSPAERNMGISVDQGLGVAKRPVIGSLFWVQADTVGSAAQTAVDLASRALLSVGVSAELYDVTVIPFDAVALPDDQSYPDMPD